jgi:phosphoribosylglycinamide formyltransferase-1
MGSQVNSDARKRVVLLASGEGSVAQALIDAVHNSDGALRKLIEIALVISENSTAGILKRAEAAGIPSALIEFSSGSERREWELSLQKTIAEQNPWLVVSAGFMKILSPEFVRQFRIINTHPSLLPLFPGAHAVRDALAAGVEKSGCTLHYVDEGVDTGTIIAQREINVEPGEDQAHLHERIKVLERELLVTGILSLLEEEK